MLTHLTSFLIIATSFVAAKSKLQLKDGASSSFPWPPTSTSTSTSAGGNPLTDLTITSALPSSPTPVIIFTHGKNYTLFTQTYAPFTTTLPHTTITFPLPHTAIVSPSPPNSYDMNSAATYTETVHPSISASESTTTVHTTIRPTETVHSSSSATLILATTSPAPSPNAAAKGLGNSVAGVYAVAGLCAAVGFAVAL